MSDIIIGGLLLPLWVYLRPRALREWVATLTGEAPEDYSAGSGWPRLRMPRLTPGLWQFILQCTIAWLFWGLLLMLGTLGTLSAIGYEVDWIEAGSGMASGLGTGLGLGVAVGLTMGLEYGAVGVVLGLTFGLGLAIGDALPGRHMSLIGSVATGVGIGVGLGLMMGMAESRLSGRVGVGRKFLMRGGPIALGSFIVAGLLLALVGDMQAGVRSGTAAAAATLVTFTHVMNLPAEYLSSLASWVLVRRNPRLSTSLWRLSPVRWDEVILLPIPGLSNLLVVLYRSDPVQGHLALMEVAAHRFQYSAVPRALVQIADEEARLVTSAPSLAAFHRGLGWLSDDLHIPNEIRNLVFRMRDVSREVASALESDSATNRVRRLEAAADLLDSLRLQPGESALSLARWADIVAVALEEARRQQRIEEPIPQVYVSDGRPIRPARCSESMTPFKGRATLFRQLETALGGGEGQRATLLLYGQRRTGKTSVLLHLPQRLGSRIVPAFVDLQSEKLGGAGDAAGLLRGLADEVVNEARRHGGINLPTIDPKVLSQDPYPAFGRWLDQVEGRLGDRTLLLCLDEFEVLEQAIQDRRLDRRILDTLRNVVQHRRRVAVLLSGSHQIDELPPYWPSALITTNTLSISFLEGADTRELIEKPVADFPSVYAPAAVERILQITHCQPYLVQLVCALLVERMNANRRMPPESYVEVEDVEAVILPALERGENYFLDLWHNQTGSEDARRLLEALARQPPSETESVKMAAVVKDADALRDALQTLIRREIVERTDGGYRITVPLVAEYIRQHVLM